MMVLTLGRGLKLRTRHLRTGLVFVCSLCCIALAWLWAIPLTHAQNTEKDAEKQQSELFRSGYRSGYADGYRDAFRAGYQEGHKDGYKLGREESAPRN